MVNGQPSALLERGRVRRVELGDYIRSKMPREWNTARLAKETGVPHSTLGPILRNATPWPDAGTLLAIAKVLHISFEELCRVAAGLPPEGSAEPATSEARQQLMAFVDRLDEERQRRALAGLVALYGDEPPAPMNPVPPEAPEGNSEPPAA